MKSLKEIALNYFESNPRDEVMKAFYAYHASISEPGAHNFDSTCPDSFCRWCNKTRTDVRWDDLPAKCQMRPASADRPIADIIREEEEKFHALLERGKTEIPKLVRKYGGVLNEEMFSKLWDTHGYDEETVKEVMGL